MEDRYYYLYKLNFRVVVSWLKESVLEQRGTKDQEGER